jgi:hypothetical protein
MPMPVLNEPDHLALMANADQRLEAIERKIE